MAVSTRLPVVPQQPASPRACDACNFGDCTFSVKRVTLYLVVHRQAKLWQEPFDRILANRTRNSRRIDPLIRGGSSDPNRGREIGWSIDAIERQHGQAFMHPMNASAVAAILCPERHNEAPD